MKRFVLAALIAIGFVGGSALADNAQHKSGAMQGGAMKGDGMKRGAMMGDAMTDAEVRKVDKDAKKLTLKHGEIKNLDMPPMTMVFRVKDDAMLDNVKAGDKVKVAIDKVGGQFTVMKIEPAK